MNHENLSRQVLQSALKSVKRRSFFRSYLLILWPDSEELLLEMARRLGVEILAPGSITPLLTAALAAGIKKFDYHRKRDGYDPRTWVANVYLHFWQGALEMAGRVMGFRGHASGSVWNPAMEPFLDWRSRHPGEISWEIITVANIAAAADHLFNLLYDPQGPRPWVVDELLRRLHGGG